MTAWRSPLGGPRVRPRDRGRRTDRVEEWPEERIQAEFEEIERAKAVTAPETEGRVAADETHETDEDRPPRTSAGGNGGNLMSDSETLERAADRLCDVTLAMGDVDLNALFDDDVREFLSCKKTIEEMTLRYRHEQHATERNADTTAGDDGATGRPAVDTADTTGGGRSR
ncbi:hypothetical protein [Natrinema halophilum]|uniref:Uncharacterized protein n=1 Tax=Natrinema halophilum TaxID=1699371 RepID=A0A7D5KS42_9EURY|nr:hypothetical protein [Natrinema halophilum]QLG49104.1 hypothetical protein HYG82_09695 [Natrinema halophilum]